MAGTSIELNTILMRSTFKITDDGSIGTAFILGKQTEDDPDKAYYVLITANHVLDEMRGDEAVLDLRKKSGGSYQKIKYPIPIRDKGNDLWVKHPDVDIAAMYVDLPNNIDLALLSIQLLADDKLLEKYEVHPGDELFCLGYPLGAEANQEGFPILRSGKISSFPIIPAKTIKYILFDFEIFSGNSGGPVYFIDSGRTYGGVKYLGETIQFIIGLISQEFIITEEIESLYETRKIKHPLALAKIIHASFIKETVLMLPPQP